MKKKTNPSPHASATLALKLLKADLLALEKLLKLADPKADVLTLPGTTHKHVVLLRTAEGTLMLKQMSRRGEPGHMTFTTECSPVPFELIVESLANSIEHSVRRKVS